MAATKERIAAAVFAATSLSKAEAREAVRRLLGLLSRSLAEGTPVLVSGFGRFGVRDKAARRGRNPQTNESLELPARRVVVFKTSGQLRRRLNGGIIKEANNDGED